MRIISDEDVVHELDRGCVVRPVGFEGTVQAPDGQLFLTGDCNKILPHLTESDWPKEWVVVQEPGSLSFNIEEKNRMTRALEEIGALLNQRGL